ncbi:Crp/Fnr family transcriptional regulator [Chitinophaga nivalis]|uniref:Crp/Fnr family transcriptional regulator n=1 Tax=Chitinophaga nivalis TaxID=2991709 RepID=A0ABT3ILZ2_9BACT|nr:Crp/Fnr family transcriptional regulator [Chitinophaga nivalis]MCW3465332.1 Crp/Fnr family transcriptional regulator [Chitinophaga nivalis]MCW3484976.1 Crp/Fnr family transcriptional regulator [Chitinophaga nivalis]
MSLLQENILHHLSAMAPLSAAAAAALTSCCQLRKLPKNHLLVHSGDHSDKLFFVVQGALRAYFLQDEKDITDWFAFENNFITAIVSFLGQVPSPHQIETMEPSLVLVIDRHDLEIICRQHPDMEHLYRLCLADTLLKLQQHIIAQRYKTAADRYAALISSQPGVVNRVPLKHIASYLGISQESLSRIRGRR